MKPIIGTTQAMLDVLAGRFHAVVDALPDDALNWQPTASGTNSIAQLVRHTMAVQNLLLQRGLGETPNYSHEDNIRNDPATKAELHALIDGAKAHKDEYLARLDSMDMSEVFAHPARGPITRAWYVIHTADHGAEHVGHAELTVQMHDAK